MEWWVIKTGVEMFDAAHAYGLGTLLATAGEGPVTLCDRGLAYYLSGELRGSSLHPPLEILDHILQLPREEEVASFAPTRHPLPLPFTNLDGLLAALYSQQGIHLVSLAELEQKQHWSPAAGGLGLHKVQQTLARLKSWTRKHAQDDTTWLEHLLADYHPDSAAAPRFSPTQRGRDPSLWMTIDPSVGHSTRQPLSDGLIALKSNLTMRTPRYAVLLAVIGAARFLRAQPVAGQRVNYYLPLATHLTLTAETSLPALPVSPHSSSQALATHWLRYSVPQISLEACWLALAYQTLSSGGARQAFSIIRGTLPCAWISTVERHTGQELIRFWHSLLTLGPEQAPFEGEHLCEALLYRDGAAWWAHLINYASIVARFPEKFRPYTYAELQEVSQAMTTPSAPLKSVLERKQGTLRFGHALRLLGQSNHAHLLDVLDQLERIQTLEQLIMTLKGAAQYCTLASARSRFIIVPDDDDLAYLLGDTDQYGVRLIASLLQILSALRYPSSGTEPGPGNACSPDRGPAASPPPGGSPPALPTEGETTHGE